MKYFYKLSIYITLSALFIITGCSDSNDSKGGNTDPEGSGASATCRINYIGNGNYSGESPADDTEYLPGDTATITGNTGNFRKTGYMFRCWNTAPDGTGTDYLEGDMLVMDKSDLNLYVKWGRWLGLEGSLESKTQATGVCTDADGNIYVAGYTSGSLNEEILIGTKDMFLIKYDSSGIRQWTKQLGASGVETISEGICYDTRNNCLIVTGYTGGSFNGESMTGTIDMMLIKFDVSGDILWIRLLGVSEEETYGYGVCADKDGNFYVTGKTSGDIDGDGIFTANFAKFIVKYNDQGTVQWSVHDNFTTSDSSSIGFGICADSENNFYVIDSNLKTAKYRDHGFYCEKIWQDFIHGNKSNIYANAICADKDGNCYVTGSTDYEFGDQTLSGSSNFGTRDLFVLKYDPDGNMEWTRFLGVSEKRTYGNAICIDEFANTYVTGYTMGDLDGHILTGDRDAFAVKYNRYGEKIWSKLLGAAGEKTYGNAICLLSKNKVYVAGETYGYLDGMSLSGEKDAFVTSWFWQ